MYSPKIKTDVCVCVVAFLPKYAAVRMPASYTKAVSEVPTHRGTRAGAFFASTESGAPLQGQFSWILVEWTIVDLADCLANFGRSAVLSKNEDFRISEF